MEAIELVVPRRTLTLVFACAMITACGGGEASSADADTGAAGEERVTLTAQQVANAGFTFAVVEARTEAGTLEATAQIEAAPDRVAKIASRVPGRILAVNAALGDRVSAGQVLVTLDSPEVGQAKADYLSALATLDVAEQTASREKQLFERRISAEREWREAEAEALRARAAKDAAENRLHALGLSERELETLRSEGHYSATMTLRSPLGGVVAERTAAVGAMVEPMNALLTVMDLREVWSVVDVYEQNLRQIRVGQDVEVTTTAYPEQVFRGRVANIGAVIETQTRSVKVRVVLPNREDRLKPGMFATVGFRGAVQSLTPKLYIPVTAVQRDGNRTIAFVPVSDRVFAVREITVGTQAGDLLEVTAGLAAGDRVVTTGSFLLKSELRRGELGEREEH